MQGKYKQEVCQHAANIGFFGRGRSRPQKQQEARQRRDQLSFVDAAGRHNGSRRLRESAKAEPSLVHDIQHAFYASGCFFIQKRTYHTIVAIIGVALRLTGI
jgi:hypothetical protein